MNEEELKAIWKNNENLSLDDFDFQAIKQKALQSQHSLRRKMRWELVFGIVLYVLIVPVCFAVPRILLLVPIMIASWVWYLWEIRRIYRLESDIQDFANFKEFLIRKRRFLRGYIKRIRIAYFGVPFVFSTFFIVLGSFEEAFNKFATFISILVFCQVLTMFLIEINLWLVYRSPLDETEDLLRQLDETQ
jgi:hypothetical protein